MEDERETKEVETAAKVAAAPKGPVEIEMVEALRYSVELFDAFGAVCDKAKSGVQSCQAVAAFVQERANMEAAYARAMTKIAANGKADDWAPGFAKCWHLVQTTLAGLGKLHTDSAAKMQSTMVAGARAFAAQQEIQVQRLIAEGTKFRTAQQNMYQSMERAKEKYDKRCAEAMEITASIRRSDHAADGTGPSTTHSSNGNSPPTPPASSSSASGAETGGDESMESVGQLLTKMWDTKAPFKPSLERQRSKLEGCLDELLVAEKRYVERVEYVNAQRLVVEREITENLHAFQLTEEQRVEYLKDLLLRMQKLFLLNLEMTQPLIQTLRDGTSEVNEFVDIEDGFRKLTSGVDSDSQVLDPNDNAFYQRMCQVQAMSDRGHQVGRVIHATFTDLLSIEDHFVSSTQRLIRAHEAPASSSSGDLFSMSTALSQVCGEGRTMQAGWDATKDQTTRLGAVHLEYRSLVAEPVALNIHTMKQEYESARAATHESFSKTHGSLCHDTAAHQKLKLKLDAKSKEFAQFFSSLPDMGEIDLRNLDVTQALVLVQQLASTFTEKEKRLEGKLKAIADEVREAQQKVADSLATLKQRCSSYIQDVDVFISVYMKNEKFRLQVEKSSLVSFTKALKHTAEGATVGVKSALEAIEQINPSVDVSDFVRANRKPRERITKAVVVYHCDAALKEALEAYRRDKPATSVVSSPSAHPSPLKRTNSNPPTAVSATQIDRSLKTSMSSVDEEKDQPMAMSEFQKKFKLDVPEQVVESYSCALYANNFPNHGRMYLTRNHICFAGWRDTVYVVSYLDIMSMEKKNSAIIVPNAIEITANGEKAFFTSFVFRDECLQCILQLQSIQKAAAVAAVIAAADSIVVPAIETGRPEMETNDQAEDVPSPTSVAPVSQVVHTAPQQTLPPVEQVAAPPVVPAVPNPPPRIIPEKDSLLDEYEVVVDEEAPFSVDFAFARIWIESPVFLQRLLESGGETLINISPWGKQPVTYTALTKSDTFEGSRVVSYTHNKKYMVGPSSIPTSQTQRFKWDPHTRLVIGVTTVVSDVPYCDYFRAENRWVFSNTAKEGVCKVQVGIRIHWLKSTWLKKQIESTAMGEAKETVRTFVTAAIHESKTQQKNNTARATAVPRSDISASSTVNQPVVGNQLSQSDSTVVEATMSSTDKQSAIATEEYVVTTQEEETTSGTALPLPQHSLHVVASTESSMKSLLQLANVFCLVLFLFTMYRIGTALDQMHAITRESLVQQRQQQEMLRDLLQKLIDGP